MSFTPDQIAPAPELDTVLSGGFYDTPQIALEGLKAILRIEALLTRQVALLERTALGIEHQNGVSARTTPKTRRKAS